MKNPSRCDLGRVKWQLRWGYLCEVLSLSDLCEQCVESRKEPVKALGLRDTPNHPRNGQEPQGGQLKGQWRRAFEKKYGNLLGLVNIEVQPAALSALTQYYDLPLRYFTFQGFQLAPILEEYERLIRIPYDKSPHYRGHYPSWASMARLLKVPELEILKLKKNRNGVEGIPEAALEERLQQLQEEDWLAFVDVYELLVYGIMLFPQIERYVDLGAIDAFLRKRDRGEHPVVAVLANTYYTLDYCSKKNGKGLS
ncbi:hypothetical protein CR513_26554, partial [Mucuna pruriens]